jgi:hypothetical protein
VQPSQPRGAAQGAGRHAEPDAVRAAARRARGQARVHVARAVRGRGFRRHVDDAQLGGDLVIVLRFVVGLDPELPGEQGG